MNYQDLIPEYEKRVQLIQAILLTGSPKPWRVEGSKRDWNKVAEHMHTTNNAVRKQWKRVWGYFEQHPELGRFDNFVEHCKLLITNQKPVDKWRQLETILANTEFDDSLPTTKNKKRPKPEKLIIESLPGNILVIGDTHFPFMHPDYLAFCLDVKEQFACDTVIHIGDLVDNHAMSFHDTDPDGYSARKEYKEARKLIKQWVDAFPNLYGLLGNHDLIPHRKAFASGLSNTFMKSFEEAWELPETWQWFMELEINGVIYTHGTGNSGKTPALSRAENYMMPVVSGHIHTAGGAYWKHGRRDRIWGLNVGCGVDGSAYAMAYGRYNTRGDALGCGVVLEGNIPIFIPMY